MNHLAVCQRCFRELGRYECAPGNPFELLCRDCVRVLIRIAAFLDKADSPPDVEPSVLLADAWYEALEGAGL